MKALTFTSEQVTLIAALLALLASLCAGAISLYTARLRRFSSERWWERKAQSYADLFEALFYVQLSARMRLEDLTGEVRYAKEYMEDFNARSDAGYLEIRKAAVTGAFLFSKPAAERLQRLQKEIDDPHHNHTLFEELEADLVAVTAGMEDLRPIALADLKLS